MESLIAVLLGLFLLYVFTLIPKSRGKSKEFGKGLFINNSGIDGNHDPDFRKD
jgi:hypothetical protein